MPNERLTHVIVIFFVFIVNEAASLSEGAPCMADGYPGTCRPWRQCFNLVLDLRDGNYPPLCSYDGNEPVLCCTSCDLTEDVSKVVLNPTSARLLYKTEQKSWNKCIDYFLDLPYDRKDNQVAHYRKAWNATAGCFQFVSSVVAAAGGRDAKRAEFPHMALLGYGVTKSTAQWLCGGSLLNQRFILTAAHCISRPDVGSVKYAALGILKRFDPEELWQTYVIRKIIPFPEYHSPSKYHDIALLQTRKRIWFSLNVLPTCLPNLAEPADDDTALATGWGTVGPGSKPADTLQAVWLHKFTPSRCSMLFKKHRHLTRGYSDDTQICYGDEDEIKDTCDGDSGGPLQITGQAYYEQRTVIGVTSHGPACGRAAQAGVYTRVAPYVAWIDSIIWKTRPRTDRPVLMGENIDPPSLDTIDNNK